ncbi:S-layer homology domain-containing protein [Anaerovorax odorimutans]|uniref:S-layer homology domain-containing protein n=1 Tax=Anaerovorax odorimutans TaxID=109327 RepID=UPI0003F4AD11|nr:S-layer homology domain-containing protein [Anaerovorax odorimutans]
MNCNCTGNGTTKYQNYTDFSNVSGWAGTYVKEVLAAHIFNGTNATNISPK